MSQGARTRVQIGSATPLRSTTPRTIEQAFGPYARLHVERTGPVIRDRTIAIACVVAIAAALLIVNLT